MGAFEAARWYAKHGWDIIPVWSVRDGRCSCGNPDCKKNTGKHPIGNLIPNGLKSATTDLSVIESWWRTFPDANVATTSFLRVDVDTRHDGKEHWRILMDTFGDVDTVHCLTPSGGDHYYFRTPPGVTHGNVKGDLPSGIDIRGDRMGYTLLPPSNHLQGIYEWELSSRPDQVQIAIAPDWLLDLIGTDKAKVQANFNNALDRPDLSRWRLSGVIEGAILDDRSRVDQGIIHALVRAGASDDEIRAVFRHYPTTGKYGEKGAHGDDYLAISIANSRSTFAPADPRPQDNHVAHEQAVAAFRQNRQRIRA